MQQGSKVATYLVDAVVIGCEDTRLFLCVVITCCVYIVDTKLCMKKALSTVHLLECCFLCLLRECFDLL